jgi:hypothetical protein
MSATKMLTCPAMHGGSGSGRACQRMLQIAGGLATTQQVRRQINLAVATAAGAGADRIFEGKTALVTGGSRGIGAPHTSAMQTGNYSTGNYAITF